MKTRAAKRQKRKVVQSSESNDSDQDEYTSNTTQPASPERHHKDTIRTSKKQQSSSKPIRSSQRSTPQRKDHRQLRQAELSFSKHSSPTGSFTKQSQETVREDAANDVELEDDLIQDNDSDILEIDTSSPGPDLGVSKSNEESQRDPADQSSRLHHSKLPLRKSHLLHDARGASTTKQRTTSDVDLPWVQRFPPRGLEELGVHKKKMQEVQTWLELALQGKARQRLLLLRGPPGAGKTATLQALQGPLSFILSEWRNVLDTTSSTGEYTSILTSFEEFLGRGERYGSLQFKAAYGSNTVANVSSAKTTDRRKILLVEDFPSSLFGNSSSLSTFREVLVRFLSIQHGPAGSLITQKDPVHSPPLVVIISESAALSSGDVVDAFTAHRLLGPDILSHPSVATIDFNPVAVTILLKVLESTLKKAAPGFRERKAFPQFLLRRLSEGGDIRSAISSLEFLYQAQGNNPKPTAISDIIAVSQRETALELFHAIGKVVYNKRRRATGQPSTEPPSDQTPSADLVSEFDVQQVIDETGRDATTFVAALHENYVPSCAGADFVDRANACISALSDADLLSTDALSARSGGVTTSALYGSANVDALRQTSMSTTVAVRGLLAALPYPVNRRAASSTGPAAAATTTTTGAKPGGGSSSSSRDAFKMFYPESMRLRNRTTEMAASASSALGAYRARDAAAGASNVDAFALEVVPYLAAIRRAGGAAAAAAAADAYPDQALESLVSYETLAKSAAAPPAVGRGLASRFGVKKVDAEQNELSAAVEEKLYLSDDDIEE